MTCPEILQTVGALLCLLILLSLLYSLKRHLKSRI